MSLATKIIRPDIVLVLYSLSRVCQWTNH